MRELKYKLIDNDWGLPALAQEVSLCPVLGLDIETASQNYRKDPDGALDPHRGLIRLIQLNTGVGVYVVDMFKIKDARPLLDALRAYPGIFIGQNLGFEAKWLYEHYNIEISRVFDTWRADCLIYNGKNEIKHDLYAIWKRYLDQDPQAADRQTIDWSGELTKGDYDYAAEDVLYLLELRDIMKQRLAKDGLNVVAAIEFDVVLPEALVSLNGFGFDKEAWLELAEKNKKDKEKYETELLRTLPSPTGQIGLFGYDSQFNLDSNQQLLTSLRKLGITERIKDPETHKINIVPLQSTGEMVLAAHAADYPIISKILDYRQKATYLKMFGPDYLKYVNPVTGRIHPSAYPFTGAGRYAFSNPNLQQIPRDKAFRRCFRAAPGKVLVVADYSTIEMRVIAQITQDRELIKCFNAKDPLEKDIHTVTASTLLGKKLADIGKAERQQAKAVNFGFCLVPGTEVITSIGVKPIENIAVGDVVLTHRNNWKKVTKVYSRNAEDIVTVKTRSGKIVKSTPEHMWYSIFPSANGKQLGAGWVEARDLKVGGYLKYHGQTYGSNSMSVGIEACRLMGWYISEGHYNKRSGFIITQDTVANPDVYKKMVDTLRGVYNCTFIEKSESCSSMHIPIEVVKQKIIPLGIDLDQRSAGKYLPDYVKDLVLEERLELLGALWDGDGCVSNGKNRKHNISYSSISPKLIQGIKGLLDSVGINSTIYGPYKNNTIVLIITGSQSKVDFIAKVKTVKTKRINYNPSKRFFAEEHIESIITSKYNGPVYDLTVEDDHSFIANGLVTHNCFGMQPDRFVQYAQTDYGVTFSKQKATKFRELFMEKYAGVNRWHSRAVRDGQKQQYTRTIAGRIRYLGPESFNEYLNSPVQGSAADALKRSLRIVYNKFKKYEGRARIVHHVHDEIVTEVDNDPVLIEAVKLDLQSGMVEGMSPFVTCVPILVEPSVGLTWADKS